MAKLLTSSRLFDSYIAIAPEGHIYGFFFELVGAEVLEILVDYPPNQVEEIDDLSSISGKKVLLIEDDVISGTTLRLVLENLQRHSPHSVSLCLRHMKSVQHIENVPDQILKTYLAEDYLQPDLSQQYIKELESCWAGYKKGQLILKEET